MQQNYRGTPMPKGDFNKVALQLKKSLMENFIFCAVLDEVHRAVSVHFWSQFPKDFSSRLNSC